MYIFPHVEPPPFPLSLCYEFLAHSLYVVLYDIFPRIICMLFTPRIIYSLLELVPYISLH